MINDQVNTVKNLLLADDDADDCEVFCSVVTTIAPAIKVECVSNGRQLMDLLRHYVPDILFLDLEMPYKNGLECLVEIRSHAQLKDLPVVAFSSTNRPANIQTAYEMGAHLFLLKSPFYSEFTAALKSILLNRDWRQPDRIREQYCINGRYTAFQ
ncbi:MAG TPA: response regulator [Flavisolibacter sp.]|jgi:CheY-like chemotaxis protein|nr:response regulator [Flavisolibacter sp.]